MRKLSRTILLFVFLFSSIFSFATENTWDKRESIGGSKRERAVGFVIGNRGYIALGQDTLNLMCNDLWEYDPGTNSWTQKANFPGQARRDAAAFTIGLKAYVGTGHNNADAFAGTVLNDMWEYSPVTNSWTAKAAFPGSWTGGIYYSTGFSVLGKGYLCCGKLGASNYSNQLWEYTPTTNTWLQKANYPYGGRYGGVAFVINNIAYFGTGTDENVFTNDFCKYNPATNMWTPIASFPGSERFSCSSFVLNGNGYVVLGSDGGYKDELWMYVPGDDYWYQKAAFPGGARRSAIAFNINNRAYAGSGKGLSGTRRDFWEYTPNAPVGISEDEDIIAAIFPNPCSDATSIILSPEISSQYQQLSYQLFDMQGRVVRSSEINMPRTFIERDNIRAGNYLLCISSDQQFLSSKLIIFE